MSNSHSVTEKVISTVCNLTKSNLMNIRKEIQIMEPLFDKWAKASVKDDMHTIKFSGVVIHSEDAARTIGAVILQAKTEGFLIAMMAQDQEWAAQHFLDTNENTQNEMPYKIPIMALREGKLDKHYYDELEKSLTKDEKTDSNNWKVKAIAAFQENEKNKAISQSAKGIFKEEPPKNPGVSEPPVLSVDP